MKTFIRWQGNKSNHINKFKQYIPEFSGTYIEPFLGSGALLLYLQPSKWIINDINKDLINIWNQVKNNPSEIINKFQEFGESFKQLNNAEKIQFCKKTTLELETLNLDFERAYKYMLMKFCAYMGNIIDNNKYRFPGLDMNIYINSDYTFVKKNI